LLFFKKFYEIEDEIKESNAENRFYTRLTRSISLTHEFKDWIKVQSQKFNPESLAGKALKYALNEWSFMMNCFTSGEFRIDNNYIESHIRPFTIGRKNWMFSVTPEGATTSANLYSLVETAKANGIDPFDYLNNVFTNFPQAQTENDFLKLLPVKIVT
jgi:transposase